MKTKKVRTRYCHHIMGMKMVQVTPLKRTLASYPHTHTHNHFTNRGRYIDHPSGRHSIRTNQQPTSIPHFYARCPSCRNPSMLSWVGTGTKYAGLHTQWCG